jgi:dihydrofolate reductase
MRKVIVTNIVSLDGYVAGPGGNPLALPMDETFDAYCAERLRTADTLLLGRATYEALKGFWPEVESQPDAPDVHREISSRNNAIQKIVVSDRISKAETTPWADTTRILRRAEAHEAIAAHKESGDKDILVFGAPTLWNDLLKVGLVDELHLIVGAVALGDGIPAFNGPLGCLQRLDVRPFEGSSNVLITFRASSSS